MFNNFSISGPATVGGIKPGCFRIGNTGGMMDNIIRSKLYRPGSVAYVSRYLTILKVTIISIYIVVNVHLIYFIAKMLRYH